MLLRIVSLEPSVTSTLIALGQREALIAVTRYCHRLADVSGLPELETTWSVSAAHVAALGPDLVIAGIPYRAGKIDELLRKKLNVLCLYPESLADVYVHIRWLARLCGVAARADEIVSAMQDQLASLALRAADRPRQRVYVEAWPNPLITAAPWIAEIVVALGGQFVPGPVNQQIDSANVVGADPEVIILNWAGVQLIDPSEVYTRPGWGRISAVQNRRVVVTNEIYLNAPGPKLSHGMIELWNAMYPDDVLPG